MADDWEKRHIVEEVVKSRLVGAGHSVNITTVGKLTEEMAAGWESLDRQKLELADKDPALAAAFIGAWKEAQACLDFLHVSEIPYLAMELLEDHSVDVQLDVLIVDEYQDLNRAEVGFIELLGTQLKIIAIGDDDQSIYGWRQANPTALLEFPLKFGAPSFELSLCYRCGERILAPAMALIQSAPTRAPKSTLTSVASNPGTFAHLRFANAEAEYDGIAKLVKRRVDAGIAPRDIAILVRARTDKFRPHLEPRLRELDITLSNPDWIKEVLERNIEVRRLLALARLVDTPTDSLAMFSYLLNTAGLGFSSLMTLYEAACAAHVTFAQFVRTAQSSDFLSVAGSARGRVKKAMALLDREIEEMRATRDATTIGPGGWGGWLIERGRGELLTADARRLFSEVGDVLIQGGEDSLASFVNRVEQVAKDIIVQDENAVRLMTMNSSKGLTVNTVFLMGVDNVIVPAQLGDIDEERRILYVGMTRATDFEVVSFAERRQDSTAVVGTSGIGYYGERSRSSLFSRLPGIPVPESGLSFIDGLES
jgi:superfamily I DNA/RNA helicase